MKHNLNRHLVKNLYDFLNPTKFFVVGKKE